jgi:gliding motility-associated-like protein
MSADPASWTGSLQAQVAVSPTNPLDSIADAFSYNYRWYKADQYPSGSYIATTALVDRLDTGTYILEVTNTVTGCSNIASYRLEASFMNAELSVSNTDQTYCSGNAVINFEQVTYGNQPADPNDFTFFIYHEADTATAIDSVGYTPGMPLFENLESGSYLVKARHNIHFIYTEFVEAQINFRPIPTVIDLLTNQLRPQISCDPLIGTGALAINITSPAQGQDLIITWYRGRQVEASQQIIVQDPFFVDNLSSGYYTVNVLDQVSGCQTQQTFFVEDQSQQPEVLADSSPSTTCDPSLANGSVMASVNKPGSYAFSWYVGTDTTGIAQHQGARWAGLTPGNYTVVATDNQTGTCSGMQTVTVNDASRSPRVNINVVSQNTACDPTLANGVLMADVENPIYEYDFRWYDQNGNQVGNYSMLGKASQGIYALEVTYLPTGCVSRTQAMVRNIPVTYPEPTIEVVANQTNCGEPDGAASARMLDYDMAFTFTWYDQRGNRLPDAQVSYNDVLSTSTATGLAAGTYSVQATSSVTGCITPAGSITIQDESQTADFTIEAEPASCSLANGLLKVSTSAQTNIVSISWFNTSTGETFESESVLENATAGDYEFTITWENGCTTEGTTTLEAQVSVFNGVSPNGDGDNEVFWIDCIEKYPFNVVKIFNRAGALIYQDSGYDNKSVYFDGTGNKGIYVDSNNLPAGTYFYVIEFNDGEKKPVTGYLELFQ